MKRNEIILNSVVKSFYIIIIQRFTLYLIINSLVNIFGDLWKSNRNLRGLNYHHVGNQYGISENILSK